MSPETENLSEVRITDSIPADKHLLPLYVLLPLCALASTFICTGGWQSGLRATLLGGSLLLGVFLVKRVCTSDMNWSRRTGYFIIAGILSGLFAASLIWILELGTGLPDLPRNPYTQSTENLFWMCPLYGFLMLACFSLAFNLSCMARYFIVLAGAALANTFGLVDMAVGTDIWTYTLGILQICIQYYVLCLGNCIIFVLLWSICADRICNKPLREKKIWEWIALPILGVIVGYILFMVIGSMTLSINPERFLIKHRNTVFAEKLNGIIIIERDDNYYDCQERVFCDLPRNIKKDKDFLQKDKKAKLKTKGKIDFDLIREYYIVNDSVYYIDGGKLLRLKAPEYDKAELILDDFEGFRFCISPDEKFVAYSKRTNAFGFRISCIMNLKSGKILALKKTGFINGPVYWVNNINELKEPKEVKK